jgi:hypothetical protein
VLILGVGTAAGWLYPIGTFVEKNGRTSIMQVTECNAIVKTATNFFKSMCLPGALTSFYNPFGKLCSEKLNMFYVISKEWVFSAGRVST